MANGNKYPPTELKLDNLRKEGVVPYSKNVVLLALVFGLFCSIKILSQISFYQLFNLIESTEREFVANSLLVFLKLAIVVLIPLFFFVIFANLIQNKFRVKFVKNKNPIKSFKDKLFEGLGGFLAFLFSLLLLYFFLRNFSETIFDPIYSNQYFIEDLTIDSLKFKLLLSLEYLSDALVYLICFFFPLAIVSRILVLWVFKRNYAMSRDELMAEISETEPRNTYFMEQD